MKNSAQKNNQKVNKTNNTIQNHQKTFDKEKAAEIIRVVSLIEPDHPGFALLTQQYGPYCKQQNIINEIVEHGFSAHDTYYNEPHTAIEEVKFLQEQINLQFFVLHNTQGSTLAFGYLMLLWENVERTFANLKILFETNTIPLQSNQKFYTLAQTNIHFLRHYQKNVNTLLQNVKIGKETVPNDSIFTPEDKMTLCEVTVKTEILYAHILYHNQDLAAFQQALKNANHQLAIIQKITQQKHESVIHAISILEKMLTTMKLSDFHSILETVHSAKLEIVEQLATFELDYTSNEPHKYSHNYEYNKKILVAQTELASAPFYPQTTPGSIEFTFNQLKVLQRNGNITLDKEILTLARALLLKWMMHFYSKNPCVIQKRIFELLGNYSNMYALMHTTLEDKELEKVAEKILQEASFIPPQPDCVQYQSLFEKYKSYFANKAQTEKILSIAYKVIEQRVDKKITTQNILKIVKNDLENINYIIRTVHFLIDQIFTQHEDLKHRTDLRKLLLEQTLVAALSISQLFISNKIPSGEDLHYLNALTDYKELILLHYHVHGKEDKLEQNQIWDITEFEVRYCELQALIKKHKNIPQLIKDTLKNVNALKETYGIQKCKTLITRLNKLSLQKENTENIIYLLDKFHHKISLLNEPLIQQLSDTPNSHCISTTVNTVKEYTLAIAQSNAAKFQNANAIDNKIQSSIALFNTISNYTDKNSLILFIHAAINLFEQWNLFFTYENATLPHKILKDLFREINTECKLLYQTIKSVELPSNNEMDNLAELTRALILEDVESICADITSTLLEAPITEYSETIAALNNKYQTAFLNTTKKAKVIDTLFNIATHNELDNNLDKINLLTLETLIYHFCLPHLCAQNDAQRVSKVYFKLITKLSDFFKLLRAQQEESDKKSELLAKITLTLREILNIHKPFILKDYVSLKKQFSDAHKFSESALHISMVTMEFQYHQFIFNYGKLGPSIDSLFQSQMDLKAGITKIEPKTLQQFNHDILHAAQQFTTPLTQSTQVSAILHKIENHFNAQLDYYLSTTFKSAHAISLEGPIQALIQKINTQPDCLAEADLITSVLYCLNVNHYAFDLVRNLFSAWKAYYQNNTCISCFLDNIYIRCDEAAVLVQYHKINANPKKTNIKSSRQEPAIEQKVEQDLAVAAEDIFKATVEMDAIINSPAYQPLLEKYKVIINNPKQANSLIPLIKNQVIQCVEARKVVCDASFDSIETLQAEIQSSTYAINVYHFLMNHIIMKHQGITNSDEIFGALCNILISTFFKIQHLLDKNEVNIGKNTASINTLTRYRDILYHYYFRQHIQQTKNKIANKKFIAPEVEKIFFRIVCLEVAYCEILLKCGQTCVLATLDENIVSNIKDLYDLKKHFKNKQDFINEKLESRIAALVQPISEIKTAQPNFMTILDKFGKELTSYPKHTKTHMDYTATTPGIKKALERIGKLDTKRAKHTLDLESANIEQEITATIQLFNQMYPYINKASLNLFLADAIDLFNRLQALFIEPKPCTKHKIIIEHFHNIIANLQVIQSHSEDEQEKLSDQFKALSISHNVKSESATSNIACNKQLSTKNTYNTLLEKFIAHIAILTPFTYKLDSQLYNTYKIFFADNESRKTVAGLINLQLKNCQSYTPLQNPTNESLEKIIEYFEKRINIQYFIKEHIILYDHTMDKNVLGCLGRLQETICLFHRVIIEVFSSQDIPISPKEHHQRLFEYATRNMDIINAYQTVLNQFLKNVKKHLPSEHAHAHNFLYERSISVEIDYARIQLLQGDRITALKHIKQATIKLKNSSDNIDKNDVTTYEKEISLLTEQVNSLPRSPLNNIVKWLHDFKKECAILLSDFESQNISKQHEDITYKHYQNIKNKNTQILDLCKNTGNNIFSRYKENQTEQEVKDTIRLFSEVKPCNDRLLNKEIVSEFSKLILSWVSYFNLERPDVPNKRIIEILRNIYSQSSAVTKKLTNANDMRGAIQILSSPVKNSVSQKEISIVQDILQVASNLFPTSGCVAYQELFDKHGIYLNDKWSAQQIIFLVIQGVEKYTKEKFPSQNTNYDALSIAEKLQDIEKYKYIIRVKTFLLDQIIIKHPDINHSEFKNNFYEDISATVFRIAELLLHNEIQMGHVLSYMRILTAYRNILQIYYPTILDSDINKEQKMVKYFYREMQYAQLLIATQQYSLMQSLSIIPNIENSIMQCNALLKPDDQKNIHLILEQIKQEISAHQNHTSILDIQVLEQKLLSFSKTVPHIHINTSDSSSVHMCIFEIISWLAALTKENPDIQEPKIAEALQNKLSFTFELLGKIQDKHDLYVAIELFSAWKNFFATEYTTLHQKMIIEHFNTMIYQISHILNPMYNSYAINYNLQTLHSCFGIPTLQHAIQQNEVHYCPELYKQHLKKYRVEFSVPSIANAILDLSDPLMDLDILQHPDFITMDKITQTTMKKIDLYDYAFTIGLPTDGNILHPYYTQLIQVLLSYLIQANTLLSISLSHNLRPLGANLTIVEKLSQFDDCYKHLSCHLDTLEKELPQKEANTLRLLRSQFEINITQVYYLLGSYNTCIERLTQLLTQYVAVPEIIKNVLQLKKQIFTPFTTPQKWMASTGQYKLYFLNIVEHLKLTYIALPNNPTDTYTELQNIFVPFNASLKKVSLQEPQYLEEQLIATFNLFINNVKLCSTRTQILHFFRFAKQIMSSWTSIFEVNTSTLEYKILAEDFQNSANVCNKIRMELTPKQDTHNMPRLKPNPAFDMSHKIFHSIEALITQNSDKKEVTSLVAEKTTSSAEEAITLKSKKEQVAKEQAAKVAEKKLIAQAMRKQRKAAKISVHEEKEKERQRLKEEAQEKVLKYKIAQEKERLEQEAEKKRKAIEEQRKREEQRKIEAERKAEKKRIAEEKRKIEAERIAEEERIAEALRVAEEERKAEEQRIFKEYKITEYKISLPEVVCELISKIRLAAEKITNLENKNNAQGHVVGGYVRDKFINMTKNSTIKPNDIDIFVNCTVEFLQSAIPYTLTPEKSLTRKNGDVIHRFSLKIADYDIDFMCCYISLESYLNGFDFTLNAIACTEHGQIIASPNVIKDFNLGIWQTIAPIDSAFTDDPQRILRVIRLNNHVHLTISQEMIRAIQQQASTIRNMIFGIYISDFEKLFLRGKAVQNLDGFINNKLLTALIPFLEKKLTNEKEFEQYYAYCKKVLTPIDRLSPEERLKEYDRMVVLALLLRPYESELVLLDENERHPFFDDFTDLDLEENKSNKRMYRIKMQKSFELLHQREKVTHVTNITHITNVTNISINVNAPVFTPSFQTMQKNYQFTNTQQYQTNNHSNSNSNQTHYSYFYTQ